MLSELPEGGAPPLRPSHRSSLKTAASTASGRETSSPALCSAHHEPSWSSLATAVTRSLEQAARIGAVSEEIRAHRRRRRAGDRRIRRRIVGLAAEGFPARRARMPSAPSNVQPVRVRR